MTPQTLYDKRWDSRAVHVEDDGTTLRYIDRHDALADRVEAAVRKVFAQGLRTGDIHQAGTKKVGISEMGDAVVAAL